MMNRGLSKTTRRQRRLSVISGGRLCPSSENSSTDQMPKNGDRSAAANRLRESRASLSDHTKNAPSKTTPRMPPATLAQRQRKSRGSSAGGTARLRRKKLV